MRGRSCTRPVAVLIAGAILTACGGGGEKPAGGGDGAYREQALRACAAADPAFEGVQARAPERGVRTALDGWRPAVRALSDLGAPAAARAAHARLVEEARALERELGRLRRLKGGRRQPLAKKDLGRAIRARSAADSLRVAAQSAGLKGCGTAAVAATDRLLTLPYAALAAARIADYRRTIRPAELSAAAPDAVGSSLVAIYNASVPFHRNFGPVEAPSAVAREHQRAVDAVERTRDVLHSIGDGPLPVDARGRRLLRRLRAPVRRVDRAQRALLAALDRALR